MPMPMPMSNDALMEALNQAQQALDQAIAAATMKRRGSAPEPPEEAGESESPIPEEE